MIKKFFMMATMCIVASTAMAWKNFELYGWDGNVNYEYELNQCYRGFLSLTGDSGSNDMCRHENAGFNISGVEWRTRMIPVIVKSGKLELSDVNVRFAGLTEDVERRIEIWTDKRLYGAFLKSTDYKRQNVLDQLVAQRSDRFWVVVGLWPRNRFSGLGEVVIDLQDDEHGNRRVGEFEVDEPEVFTPYSWRNSLSGSLMNWSVSDFILRAGSFYELKFISTTAYDAAMKSGKSYVPMSFSVPCAGRLVIYNGAATDGESVVHNIVKSGFWSFSGNVNKNLYFDHDTEYRELRYDVPSADEISITCNIPAVIAANK